MDSRTEHLLGLDQIRDQLTQSCQSEQGRALVGHLDVATDRDEVIERQKQTREALELRRLGIAISAGAVEITEFLEDAARGGTLELSHIVDVATTARVCLDAARSVTGHAAEAPRLADRAREISQAPLAMIVDQVESAHDGSGGLRDSASGELAQARRQLADARAAASQALRDAAQRFRSHLQESFLTERGGRPVLAVKASSRSSVPGIVHDRSATGSTIFVEPLEVVDASNRVREYEALERIEVERVLARLSQMIGAEEAALAQASDALAHLDAVVSMADRSTRWRGCAVTIAEDVDLVAARHPLLDPSTVVPIDLPLSGRRGLVVSGPNAGGKTVALKTLGLLALCHQLGLQIPAEKAQLPVFPTIVADIGDDQSIEQSLSTFSGHIRHIIDVLEGVVPGGLVLLDEIAAGTDPAAGAALGRAIVGALIDRGAIVLVTTHFDELKGWASSDERVANAAVGFDAERLAPTFTLRVGEPGASHAIEVAERLGLDGGVIDDAREVLGRAREGVEALLQEAAAARVAAEKARDEARGERDSAAATLRDVEARERQLARQVERYRTDRESARAQAREDAQSELAQLQGELASLRQEIAAARKKERQRARTEASEHEAERDRRLGAADEALKRASSTLAQTRPATPIEELSVGDAVLVQDMGVRGTIVEISGDSVVVQGPSARLTLTRARLVADRLVEREDARSSAPQEIRPPAQPVVSEIDVRGERAEAACAIVREYVDTVAMSGLETVRVIHGKGTGALRKAITEELKRHPMVASTALADQSEGGDGATVVTLK